MRGLSQENCQEMVPEGRIFSLKMQKVGLLANQKLQYYEQLYAYSDAIVLEVLPADILAHKNFDTTVYNKSFPDFIPI